MEAAVADAGVDGRALPRAAYLAGLAGHEGPERRVFMDPEEQRRRFLRAMGELVVEGGFTGVSIQDVADRAEISRYAFIRHFSDVVDCFRAAMVQAEADLRGWVRVALEGAEAPAERLGAAVGAVLDFARREPVAVKLVVVEAFGAQAVGLPGYGEEFATFCAWLAAEVGLEGPGAPGSVQREASLGAVEALLARRLRGVGGVVDAGLLGPVSYFLVSALAGSGSVGEWCGNGGDELGGA